MAIEEVSSRPAPRLLGDQEPQAEQVSVAVDGTCLLCGKDAQTGQAMRGGSRCSCGAFVCTECRQTFKVLTERNNKQKSREEYKSNYKRFLRILDKTGYYLRDVDGDGNCLFYALADQQSGSLKEHAALRYEISQYIRNHKERFESFTDEQNNIETVIERIKKANTDCGQEALLTYSLMKCVQVMVHQVNQRILRINEDLLDIAPQIHLFFDSTIEHYESVRRCGSRKRQPASMYFTHEELERMNRYYLGLCPI